MQRLTESYFAATDEAPLLETSCASILREAALQWPDAVALIDADDTPPARRRWSYAELHQRAERTARALLANFEPGSHIAIWAANCPEWIVLQFGLAMAGMVMVTINPANRVSELGYVLGQSRSRAVFHQRHYRGVDMAQSIAAATQEHDLELARVVCLEHFDDFLNEANADCLLPAVAPQDPAMIQYTSGTTGRPKGALLNHFSVTNNARMMAELKSLNENTVNLAVAPLFHTGGCVAGVLGSVQTGGALLLPSAFDAASMLDLIEQEQATYTFAVPTMLVALLAEQSSRPRDLSSLETVFSGAATVPVEVVKRVEQEFNARLIIGYGQTETSPAITHTRLDDAPDDKSETIGYALPQVEVKIVDPESGATMPVGHPGELLTRGFLVMMGYYEMPEATAATIDDDGWLHTGDLCSMDERGYCRITGRLKDMIIRGGENIYPREIEEVLYAHEAIEEVAVIGLPDDHWGESVAAVLRLCEGEPVRSQTLENHVGASLARYKVPRRWFAMTEIPATASGKLQKYKLVDMFKEGTLQKFELPCRGA